MLCLCYDRPACRPLSASKLRLKSCTNTGLPALGQTLSHKLALEVAGHFGKKDYRNATVEDLLELPADALRRPLQSGAHKRFD